MSVPLLERRRIHVWGIVQGVGFRPFIFNLATRYKLAGWVLNNAQGVIIEVEGERSALDTFTRAMEKETPLLARIESLASERISPQGETEFRIAASAGAQEKRAWISPDACICDDCLRELFDPHNRRYRYPFINCTNCGPRFTIIKDVPYDRPFTTMAEFSMCALCQEEYDDPRNRRFHAQPNCCPVCGPRAAIAFDTANEQGDGAMERAAHLLSDGHILAVKGLGGYHLACDATSARAVQQLRARKHRYDKPFALMVPDVAAARELCEISAAEGALLTSRRRPIVLLRARMPLNVAPEVAPNQKYLGVMLPYTPLHYVLLDTIARLEPDQPVVLVMTSGNVSDEPIAYRDDEARERLASIADYFLAHDRAIYMRCDDSVTRVIENRELVLRRSRGYVPEPTRAPRSFHVPVLAVGAQLKNTFCLAKGDNTIVSHHIGDLENYETLQSFVQGIEHFKKLFDVAPAILACDLHPDYLSTKYAYQQAYEQASASPALSVVPVQHHHAHIASVMGEHGLTGRVIGVALDGTGYGTDGTIWGGEFLVADLRAFERVAHLDTIPLLGGEAAIHEVWRLAAAWLDKVFGDEFLTLDLDFVRQLDRAKWRVLKQMQVKNINAPLSSSVGRLFDAVSALVGVRTLATYEAQAAIELEMLAQETCMEKYPLSLPNERPRVLKMNGTIRALVDDIQQGVARDIIAAKFHNTIADAVARVCDLIRQEHGLVQVVLGGGVFQNAFLLTRTVSALRALDFEVLVPTRLPPNDGGISYGQALVANAQTAPD